MCLAKDFSEKLINMFTEIENAYNYHQESLRRVEQVQQDLLHAIENNNFNACEGYKLAKMLSDTRKERRLIKNELETLEQLKAKFIDEFKQSLSTIHESIVHRNQILKDRLGWKLKSMYQEHLLLM